MKKNTWYHIIAVFIFIIGVSCQKPTRNLYPETLEGGLELMPSNITGVNFNNTIKESAKNHHYLYSQIYLGSGVAIGDINNDGLPDIFFGGNQVADRLYLNKGNFQFEDITKKSKAAKNSGWTWGVTMADVNADGYLDIYVSRNGNSLKLEDRRNQLYINNQDLTFTESALQYGLADVGFSTQAVFFDMDNDGDLDMYQVNQPADKKLLLIHKISLENFNSFKDRIYRNDNGKFIDVSDESGISRNLAYGLSVSATDFNNDGWVDLYIANDYDEPDFMYYNNGDGTFKNVINEKLKHITQLSMGTDAADINNDGLIDLMTTDMTPEDHFRSKTNMASMSSEAFETLVKTGAHYQYMRNTLQINTGMGTFSDIGNLAGVSRTDWSWASLIVDMDNDGWKDIIVSNGIKKDVDNNDYKAVLNALDINATTTDKFFQLSKEAPSQPIANYAFKNMGNLKFEKVSNTWKFDTPSFSSGMAYGDLDNDGDLDLVINNMESEAFIYKNKSNGNFLKINLEGSDKNKFGLGAKGIIHYNGKMQLAENFVTRGYFSSVEPGLFFGLGKQTQVEKVEVIWPDGKINMFENIKANTTITATYKKAKPNNKLPEKQNPLLSKINPKDLGVNFKHEENNHNEYQEEILLPHNISQNGPFAAIGDINADGLDDLFVGGASNQSGILYIQNKNGQFTKNDTQPWEQDKESEDLGALFFDVDKDGDLDLYVTSGGSEFKQGDSRLKDRLYINNGKGVFTKNDKALPNIYESTQCVKKSDIDNDGDLDLFVGTRLISGKYGFPATSYFLINENGNFKKAPTEIAPSLFNLGMVTDAVFTDVDNDNDQDLIIVGEWMEIKVLTNTNGAFEDRSSKFGLNNTRGIWWSITATDLDNDGDDDYILGNLGENNKFKASTDHPFKVYANDFDDNGTNDIVLAKYYKNDYVPVRGRECTSQQMPFVLDKFKDYKSFASSKLVDILPDNKLNEAVTYEISSFESIILINDNGTLKKQSLPIQAQFSPIKSSMALDINADGFTDILTVGNHFGVEVETARYDAGYGTVLLGDGKNNFQFMTPLQSGFYIPNDSRDMHYIKQKNNQTIIVTNNNNKLDFFKK